MTREVGSGSGGRQITLMGNGLQLGNSCWQTREEVGGGEHECGEKRGLVLNSGQEGGRVHVTLEGEHGGIGGGGKKWQFGFPGTDNTDGQGGGGLRVDEERWREKEVKEEEEGRKRGGRMEENEIQGETFGASSLKSYLKPCNTLQQPICRPLLIDIIFCGSFYTERIIVGVGKQY